jgi:hypothetical protein
MNNPYIMVIAITGPLVSIGLTYALVGYLVYRRPSWETVGNILQNDNATIRSWEAGSLTPDFSTIVEGAVDMQAKDSNPDSINIV